MFEVNDRSGGSSQYMVKNQTQASNQFGDPYGVNNASKASS